MPHSAIPRKLFRNIYIAIYADPLDAEGNITAHPPTHLEKRMLSTHRADEHGEVAEHSHFLLSTELSKLQSKAKQLEQENYDLKIALSNTAEHGDFIEAQLYATNTQLQEEVMVRRRTELTLKTLVNLISQQRNDLEIMLETLMVHGDILDTQWQQQIFQANVLASSDGLTHIANRRRFDEYLSNQWQKMARSYAPISIILCDIDFFKQYNDTYGHPAGDACIKQVVQALSSAIYRSTDLLARYGGEEFAAVLPQTDLKQALKVAQRMQEAIAQLNIPHRASAAGAYVTISIGIASTIPLEQQSANLLLDEADRKLYDAKHSGRNYIAYHELDLSEEVVVQ
jgi:diguanylate cyclase (GGDEF)-like protein